MWSNDAVLSLFKTLFPSWFAGFAFAAIAIGALVPAAVMSIGAANIVVATIANLILTIIAPARTIQPAPVG
jgi:Na+/proline symporter